MPLSLTDLVVFALFLGAVMWVSLRAARRSGTAKGYFLAGRSLGGWAIGMSLVATNISTEHFVGMSGSAATDIGLAIASYEWTAAAALIVIGWVLLPRYLRSGIYTMPEFLERRFDRGTRTILAALLTSATVFVAMATVLYSGAVALNAIFALPEQIGGRLGLDGETAETAATLFGVWGIAAAASAYTIYGGLKAVVWSDFIQGVALLGGGFLVLWLGFEAVGAGDGALAGALVFFAENRERLRAALPADHPELPWTAVFVGGLWVTQFFYWGVNQFITQRTLAARSLAEGQRGILAAAWLKILVPFLVCLPGILAVQLYGDRITHPDQAYPVLVRELLPPALRGALLAALAGAVMSSFNSMLNSASTMYALDIHPRLAERWGRRARGGAPSDPPSEPPSDPPSDPVRAAKIASAAFAVGACLWAPFIGGFPGVFRYIQLAWGFVTPGIVAVFFTGVFTRRVPARAARAGLLAGIPLYGLLRLGWPETAFVHHIGITFLLVAGGLAFAGWKWPAADTRREDAPESDRLKDRALDLTPLPGVAWKGSAALLAIASIYLVFR